MPALTKAAPLILAAALAATAAAYATPTVPDVSGAWSFATQAYGRNCKLSGAMMIKPVGKDFSCTFVAQEKCSDISVKAKETCAVKRVGNDIMITAKVENVAPSVGYQPDNFELKVQSSSYMKGMLRSFHSAPVDFFRGETPVS